MNLAFLNNTIAKVVKAATELPVGIGMLMREDGLPITPILAPDQSVWYWVIYLEKQGSGPRPALTSQAMDDNGIAELGAGWKVGRLKIDPDRVIFGDTVVEQLNALAIMMAATDSKTVN